LSLTRTTVIIPTLNEAGNIEGVLQAMPTDLVDQVIVVDSGSSDGTAQIALEAGARVISEAQRGYGRALATGIQACEPSDFLVFMDGDGSDSPQYIPLLLEPLLHNQADLVLGTRLQSPDDALGMQAHQRFGNWLAGWWVRLLYQAPISDLGPFRAARADLVKQLDMEEMTYGWPTEMLVKALRRGARVMEVPVEFLPRRHGHSKISGTLKGTILAAYHIFKTTVRYSFGSQPRYYPTQNEKSPP
jgi:glycosyltransferase involved in cell wall biosynthesis